MTRTVLCFGDSNTHGTLPMRDLGSRERHGPEKRWAGVMAAALGDDWQVIEEGHPGRTTVLDDPIEGEHKSGLRALPVALESHRPLDLVIVMLGTNDLKHRFSLVPTDIARGLEGLVRMIKTSDAGPESGAPNVLIAAPVPVIEAGCLAEMFKGGALKSRDLAAHYADIARRFGTGFLDLGPVARVDPLDGVHLDAEAHASIGAALAETVAQMMV